MQTVRQLFVIPLVFLMAAASPALADQQHAVSPNQLAASVAEHLAQQDTDRAAIKEALARPMVREVAATMGVDLDRLATSTATFSGADLDRAAAAARQVNQQLVGGASTIVISTTTIIIVLLVVILLVAVAD